MPEHNLDRLKSMEIYGFGPVAMKRSRVCRVCRHACDTVATYCSHCGAVLPVETLFDLYKSHHRCCPGCETVVVDGAMYCPECGLRLDSLTDND